VSSILAVTGANGFIGSSVVRSFASLGLNLRAYSRTFSADSLKVAGNVSFTAVGDIDGKTEWLSALRGVKCVVHCAARAHITHESEAMPAQVYRTVNIDGTRRLAQHAVDAGVKRLIFLSSIGVLGVDTNRRGPFVFSDTPNPVEDYAISKCQAEQALRDISAKTGLEVVVLRPPLVYGPSVKGNLARLLKLVGSGLPLPLGAVQNKRSLIGLDNLVDLLIQCVDHPAAAGQTFLVCDGEDLSTPDLLRHMAAAMGRSARLVPVPMPMLRLAGSALGRRAEIDRLVGSLQIDSSHTRQVLGWTPPVSVQEGIRRMVQGF